MRVRKRPKDFCVDCWYRLGDKPLPKRPRAAPYAGPRCKTDHVAETVRRNKVAHEQRMQRVYGLTQGEYDELLAQQGGRCAILRCRATGKVKRLAVDHDHTCTQSHNYEIRRCCVRGLVCGPHNQMIGRCGDDPEVFESFASYLRNPPARKEAM